MPTLLKNSPLFVAVEQVTKNTTSWIGHRPGYTENVISGQTFQSPSEGDLNSIEVFSSIVTSPGKLLMTLHLFDSMHKTWGPVLSSASIELNKEDSNKWISFNLKGPHLHKGETYGFKLESPNTFIGVGEAVGNLRQPPFKNGQEWKFSGKEKKEDAYSYFSLAFKVGIRA